MNNFLFFLSIFCIAFTGDIYRRNVLFTLEPGRKTCFVKVVDRFGIIKAEYQIIEKSGGVSNQTVSFELLPTRAGAGRGEGARWSALSRWRHRGAGARWPAAALALHTPERGQYRFCFDNTFDRQNKKTILFKLSVQTRNKTLRDNKEIKQRRFIHPGRKTMILDPILPVPVASVEKPEVTLSGLLNHKNDNIVFTWKEKEHQNMMRLADYRKKFLNGRNKALLQEEIRQNQKVSKKVVASKNSLMKRLEVDSYPDLDDPDGDPDDADDLSDLGDRKVVSNPHATETIARSRSWLPYRWDMIDYS